jgi:hypothetical protein
MAEHGLLGPPSLVFLELPSLVPERVCLNTDHVPMPEHGLLGPPSLFCRELLFPVPRTHAIDPRWMRYTTGGIPLGSEEGEMQLALFGNLVKWRKISTTHTWSRHPRISTTHTSS